MITIEVLVKHASRKCSKYREDFGIWHLLHTLFLIFLVSFLVKMSIYFAETFYARTATVWVECKAERSIGIST